MDGYQTIQSSLSYAQFLLNCWELLILQVAYQYFSCWRLSNLKKLKSIKIKIE